MDFLKRVCGIAGNNTWRAQVVAELAKESIRESKELNAELKKYTDAPDPFMALVQDLHNKRTLHRQ